MVVTLFGNIHWWTVYLGKVRLVVTFWRIWACNILLEKNALCCTNCLWDVIWEKLERMAGFNGNSVMLHKVVEMRK